MRVSTIAPVRVGLQWLTVGLVAFALGCSSTDNADSDGSVADEAKSAVRDVADGAGEAVRDAADKTADAAHDAAEKTGDAMHDAADKTGDAMHDAADKTSDAMHEVGDKAGDAAKKLEGATGAAMKKAGDAADKAADAVTLVGTTGCGHCNFEIGTSCSAAMKTADGTIYILDGVDEESDLFQKRMDEKKLTVVGVVSEGDPHHVDVKSYKIL